MVEWSNGGRSPVVGDALVYFVVGAEPSLTTLPIVLFFAPRCVEENRRHGQLAVIDSGFRDDDGLTLGYLDGDVGGAKDIAALDVEIAVALPPLFFQSVARLADQRSTVY